MKTILFLTTLAALAFCQTTVLADAPKGWTEDYAKALEQAKTEHKKVLLDFTGSDWCGWCKKIDAEVFDTAKFKDYADKHLVLVKVDFPQSKPQSAEIKAQNEKLKNEHKVNGFPTLLIVDSHGKKTWSQSGYKPGGVDAFLKALGRK
jgi:protein disulfide-isomerase